MEAKLAAMEFKDTSFRVALANMQLEMDKNHEILVALLTKRLGHKLQEGKGMTESGGQQKTTPEKGKEESPTRSPLENPNENGFEGRHDGIHSCARKMSASQKISQQLKLPEETQEQPKIGEAIPQMGIALVERSRKEGVEALGVWVSDRQVDQLPPPEKLATSPRVMVGEGRKTQSPIDHAPSPEPPEPPDTGSLAAAPPQPESPVVGQPATASGLLLNESLWAHTFEDPPETPDPPPLSEPTAPLPDPPEPPDLCCLLSWRRAAGLRDSIADDPSSGSGAAGAAITAGDCLGLRLQLLVKNEAAGFRNEDRREKRGAEEKIPRIGQLFDLMGQAQVSMISCDNDKKEVWSHLKQYYGPLLKTKYLTQFLNEWKKFQEEWTMGLMFSGPNSNSLIKLERHFNALELNKFSQHGDVNSLKKRIAHSLQKSLSADEEVSHCSSGASATAQFTTIKERLNPLTKSKSLRNLVCHMLETKMVRANETANITRNRTYQKSLLHELPNTGKHSNILSEFINREIQYSGIPSSTVHLHGNLKLENKHGLLFFKFKETCPKDVCVAKTWRTGNAVNWVYTFHSIDNRKKSNANGLESHDFDKYSSLVAQMLVSCNLYSELEGNVFDNNSVGTEFVLYELTHSRQSVLLAKKSLCEQNAYTTLKASRVGLKEETFRLDEESLVIKNKLEVKPQSSNAGFDDSDSSPWWSTKLYTNLGTAAIVYATNFYTRARFVEAVKASLSDAFRVFFALTMTAIGISQSSSLASSKAKTATASIFEIIGRESKIDPSDESGQITLDGIVTEMLQLKWLRQQKGLVNQEGGISVFGSNHSQISLILVAGTAEFEFQWRFALCSCSQQWDPGGKGLVFNSVNQFLIPWKGETMEETTWEEAFNMRSQFPTFRLEAKSVFQEGGNDRTSYVDLGPNGPIAQHSSSAESVLLRWRRERVMRARCVRGFLLYGDCVWGERVSRKIIVSKYGQRACSL